MVARMTTASTRHFALSAIGRDRPGIVAAMSEVLLRHGLNIEDSQMTILRGHFTMMLVVSAAPATDVEALRTDLDEVGRALPLDAVALNDLREGEAPAETAASHTVAVYGLDHPGIVHSVTSALAERGVDITDLETRLAGSAARPIYALMMEVALPPGADAGELSSALSEVGSAQGVDVTVRPLETDVL